MVRRAHIFDDDRLVIVVDTKLYEQARAFLKWGKIMYRYKQASLTDFEMKL